MFGDPFKCAKEIVRVLKPNGNSIVLHHFYVLIMDTLDHFYNMTKSGLKNLDQYTIEKQDVLDRTSNLPFNMDFQQLVQWSFTQNKETFRTCL